jgi:hypothetical protein
LLSIAVSHNISKWSSARSIRLGLFDQRAGEPGKYTIIASFAGSGAYYGSHAKTAINVEEAPAPTPAPTPTPAPMTDTYVLGIGSAILIAVIIGFVLLLLRKR